MFLRSTCHQGQQILYSSTSRWDLTHSCRTSSRGYITPEDKGRHVDCRGQIFVTDTWAFLELSNKRPTHQRYARSTSTYERTTYSICLMRLSGTRTSPCMWQQCHSFLLADMRGQSSLRRHLSPWLPLCAWKDQREFMDSSHTTTCICIAMTPQRFMCHRGAGLGGQGGCQHGGRVRGGKDEGGG